MDVKFPEALEGKFTYKDKGAVWHVWCKVCKQGWSLKKENAPHPGNILSLLDHAIGCAMTPKERKKALKEAKESDGI